MIRQGERVAVFLTSPSTSEDDTSDIDEGISSLSKQNYHNSDTNVKEKEIDEINEVTGKPRGRKSKTQEANSNKVPLVSVDPVLILKDRPKKPSLKYSKVLGEDKDTNLSHEDRSLGSDHTLLCPARNPGDQSEINLLNIYF